MCSGSRSVTPPTTHGGSWTEHRETSTTSALRHRACRDEQPIVWSAWPAPGAGPPRRPAGRRLLAVTRSRRPGRGWSRRYIGAHRRIAGRPHCHPSGRPSTRSDSKTRIEAGPRPQIDDGAVAPSPQPGRCSPQLGPGQGEHKDGEGGRPVRERVEEVEQPLVGPLQVLDREHDRVWSASRSRRSRHPAKRSSGTALPHRHRAGGPAGARPTPGPPGRRQFLEAGGEPVRGGLRRACSVTPKRWRTISARAEKVTPSP